MRSALSVLVALTFATGLATAAQAVTYTTGPGLGAPPVTDPGDTNPILVTFDSPLPLGFSLAGDFGIVSGTTSAAAAPSGDTTNYFYTSNALGSGIATLSTPNMSEISFYWGSIDTYNHVDVLGFGGATLLTVNGGDIPPANGDQTDNITNRRIFFTAGLGEVITGLRFSATGVAFEIDDISGFVIPNGDSFVPEPATWAFMILGFGMVGVASRRRMRSVAA